MQGVAKSCKDGKPTRTTTKTGDVRLLVPDDLSANGISLEGTSTFLLSSWVYEGRPDPSAWHVVVPMGHDLTFSRPDGRGSYEDVVTLSPEAVEIMFNDWHVRSRAGAPMDGGGGLS